MLERSAGGLSPEADRASRVTIGHPEGFVFAFANIYRDLADIIQATIDGTEPDPLALSVPTAADGLHSIAAIVAATTSAGDGSAWTNVMTTA